MIVIALVRVSGMYYRGKFDNTWIAMWQQVEACIAVTMLSLTAFRSVFVTPTSNGDVNKASPWVPSTKRLVAKYKRSKGSEHQRLDDVFIPSATISGLSRAFHRNGTAHSMSCTSPDGTLADVHEPRTHI